MELCYLQHGHKISLIVKEPFYIQTFALTLEGSYCHLCSPLIDQGNQSTFQQIQLEI